jgi:hypothetical protein
MPLWLNWLHDQWFVDLATAFGVLGTIATLAGLWWTLWQVKETKRAAEAARDAALSTAAAARAEYARFVVSICHRFIAEAKIQVDNGNFALAAMRCSDLADQFAMVNLSTPDFFANVGPIIEELRSWDATLGKISNTSKGLSADKRRKWDAFLRKLQLVIDQVHGPFQVTKGGEK